MLMGRFENMVTKMKRLNLVNMLFNCNLWTEWKGVVNSGDKVSLKDVIETEHGKPRVGDLIEKLRRNRGMEEYSCPR